MACNLIRTTPPSLYRPEIDTKALAPILCGHAQASVCEEDLGLDNLELLVFLIYNLTHSGQDGNAAVVFTRTAVQVAERGGWLDENSSTWLELDPNQMGRARDVCSFLLSASR